MFDRSVTAAVALVLAATSVGAQTATQKSARDKAAGSAAPSQKSTIQYNPAIMQPRFVTLGGCVQHKDDYILTDATIAGQGEKGQPQPAPATTYKLEGLSGARLTLFVGKRVEVTGVYQAGTATAGAAGEPLARFEATNVNGVEGTCPTVN